MLHFATIFDSNYLPQAESMIDSLMSNTLKSMVYIIALDEKVIEYYYNRDGVICIPLNDLEDSFSELQALKKSRSYIEYIFTLSPFIPLYILNKYPEIDIITTLDADLYFFSDPTTLFQEMGEHSVMISPHRFGLNHAYLERYGKFNVSFQSFRNDNRAMICLNKWRNECITYVSDFLYEGKYAEQKYLNTWCEELEGVYVIKNKGACVAPWNIQNWAIELVDKNIFYGDSKLIFFHFHGFRINDENTIYSGLHHYGLDIRKHNYHIIYGHYLNAFLPFAKKIKTPGKLTRNAKMKKLFTPDIYLHSLPFRFNNDLLNRLKLKIILFAFAVASRLKFAYK